MAILAIINLDMPSLYLSPPPDECAGVDSDCLNADLKANKFGSTCQPLADGSQCMGGATCSKGLCGGELALEVHWHCKQLMHAIRHVPRECGMVPYCHVARIDGHAWKRLEANLSPLKKLLTPYQQLHQTTQTTPIFLTQRPHASPTAGQDAWKAEQAAAAAAKAEQLTEDTSSKTGAKVTAAKAAPAPAKPAPVKVVPAWANFSAAIMTDSTIIRVPETFLATSHEWDRITDYSANLEAFSNIFREFGPSPILRMGGASQDAMTEPPKKEIW